MSRRTECCPDWERLAAVRDIWQGEDPPGWAEATRHTRECKSCRQAALRADPALLFQRMLVPELDDHEIESIKRSVKAIRTSSRLARRRPWARSLIAAAMALAVVTLQGGREDSGRTAGSPGFDVAIEAVELDNDMPYFEYLPLVEEADPAFGPIIQLESETVSVVLVMATTGAEGVS